MNNKTRNFAIIGVIIILIVSLVAGWIRLPGFSLLSSSTNVQFSNGNVYQVATLTIDKTQSTTFLMTPQNYTLSNGSTVVPRNNVTFTFTPSQQFCTYRLDAQSDPVILGQNLNGWNYYGVGNPRLSAFVRINSSASNGDVTLNVTNVGEQLTLPASDGSGSVSAQVQGVLGTGSNCPDSSGLVVLNNNGQPRVVSQAAYNDYKTRRINDAYITCGFGGVLNPLSVSTCINNALVDVSTGSGIPEASNFRGEFQGLTFADSIGTQIKTQITGVVNPTRFANPVITLTADQAYFNSFIYSPPRLSQPQILSISCGDMTESRSATIRATFRNTGATNDIFTYTISTNKGSITPTTGTIPMNAGDQGVQNFVYSVPSVSSTEPYNVNVQLCTSNQIQSNCVQSQCNGNIIDVPPPAIPGLPQNPVTPYCGDMQCNAARGETTLTCSQDCPVQPIATQCTMPNAQLINGECICNNGYQRSFDGQTGAMMCTAPNNYSQYLVYGVAGLAILAVVYQLFFAKGSKRR